MTTKKVLRLIARIAIFGALAIILYMVPGLQFPIIPGLSFLKVHFDEIPCLIASLAYGPLTGTLLVVIKGLFKLIQDVGETGGIGALADLIYGLALILPASFIYKTMHNFKGAIIGLSVGFIVNLLFSSFLGYYIIYPLYGFYFNPEVGGYVNALQYIVDHMFSPVDPSIKYRYDFKIQYQFLLPFNVIKNLIIVGATLLVYKPVSILIDKANKE